MLKSSDPQNKMRRGSWELLERHLDAKSGRTKSSLRDNSIRELRWSSISSSFDCCSLRRAPGARSFTGIDKTRDAMTSKYRDRRSWIQQPYPLAISSASLLADRGADRLCDA